MRCRSVALIVATFLPTMAFVFLPNHRIRQFCLMTLSAGNMTEPTTSLQARHLLTELTARYGNGDWTKTRNYVYHAKDKLSRQQVNDVLQFLETYFDSSQIRSILQLSPRILRKNPFSKLKPTAQFLQQLYGKDLFQIAVSRNPDLLLSRGLGYDASSSDHNFVEIFLQKELQMSVREVSQLQRTAPFLFQIPLTKIKGVTEYLFDRLQDGGYDAPDSVKIVSKIVVSHPHLFHLSVESNLQARINFLAETCHLSKKNVASLIKSSSGILGLSVEENLKPTLDYLTQVLNCTDTFDPQALNKCVMSHPLILALSQRNIKQKVDYFYELARMNGDGMGAILAARIALRCPMVYSLSLQENVIPTIEFLKRVWGSPQFTMDCTSDDTVHAEEINTFISFLLEYPGILTLSLEGNLQPTLRFYNMTGYTQLDSDWNLVAGKPKIRGRYIAASLFHRLLPRWHFCKDQNASIQPSLHIIAGATDISFCRQLGYTLDKYLTFKEKSAPSLKFSWEFDTWLKTGRAFEV
jgi:mTERF